MIRRRSRSMPSRRVRPRVRGRPNSPTLQGFPRGSGWPSTMRRSGSARPSNSPARSPTPTGRRSSSCSSRWYACSSTPATGSPPARPGPRPSERPTAPTTRELPLLALVALDVPSVWTLHSYAEVDLDIVGRTERALAGLPETDSALRCRLLGALAAELYDGSDDPRCDELSAAAVRDGPPAGRSAAARRRADLPLPGRESAALRRRTGRRRAGAGRARRAGGHAGVRTARPSGVGHVPDDAVRHPRAPTPKRPRASRLLRRLSLRSASTHPRPLAGAAAAGRRPADRGRGGLRAVARRAAAAGFLRHRGAHRGRPGRCSTPPADAGMPSPSRLDSLALVAARCSPIRCGCGRSPRAGRVDEARALLDADTPCVLQDWSQIPVLAVAAQAAVAAGHAARMHWYYEHLLPYSGWFAVGGNTLVVRSGRLLPGPARRCSRGRRSERRAPARAPSRTAATAGLLWWAERCAALGQDQRH